MARHEHLGGVRHSGPPDQIQRADSASVPVVADRGRMATECDLPRGRDGTNQKRLDLSVLAREEVAAPLLS